MYLLTYLLANNSNRRLYIWAGLYGLTGSYQLASQCLISFSTDLRSADTVKWTHATDGTSNRSRGLWLNDISRAAAVNWDRTTVALWDRRVRPYGAITAARSELFMPVLCAPPCVYSSCFISSTFHTNTDWCMSDVKADSSINCRQTRTTHLTDVVPKLHHPAVYCIVLHSYCCCCWFHWRHQWQTCTFRQGRKQHVFGKPSSCLTFTTVSEYFDLKKKKQNRW